MESETFLMSETRLEGFPGEATARLSTKSTDDFLLSGRGPIFASIEKGAAFGFSSFDAVLLSQALLAAVIGKSTMEVLRYVLGLRFCALDFSPGLPAPSNLAQEFMVGTISMCGFGRIIAGRNALKIHGKAP